MCKKIFGYHTLQYYIYRTLQFIVFLTLSNLNRASNYAVTHTSYKMHENRCVLLKSDMHVRPMMRFTVLCTPTDSSDKTKGCVLLYWCASLYHSLIVVQPSLTTVPCPATKLSLLISKSFVGIRQSVISVALKTPLKTRLGICIYKTSLPHRPDDYIGFTSSCPPHFTTKLRPWESVFIKHVISCWHWRFQISLS